MDEIYNQVLFTGKMKYSPDTFRRLTELQYNTFNFATKIFQTILGVVLVVFGLFQKGDGFGLICIAAGCFTLVSLNLNAKLLADKLSKQFTNGFPELEYSFTSMGVSTQQIQKETPYSSVIRLVDDGKYLYLFIDKMTVFMIESSSIKGNNGLNGLKKLIEKKTGLEWKKPFTLLGTTLGSLKDVIALSKERSDTVLGERLEDKKH